MNTDNSSSTTFSKAQDKPVAEPKIKATKPDSQAIVDSVEVPFLDYGMEHGHPLAVDYFNLGDNWDVHAQEVGLIDSYFKGKIHDGTYANNTNAIKTEIKNMEKTLDIKKETRTVLRLGILANHIKFLISTDDLKNNMMKYG